MVLGGYQTGFELVKGIQPEAIENFTMICSRGAPRMLLPPAQPMMQTAMASFLSGRRLTSLVPPLAQMASRIGGPLSRISSNVSLLSKTGGSSPLRQLISKVLERNDFQIALRVSFGRPNGKTVAMAISNAGEVLCYVKLGSEAMTSDLVAHEGAMLEQFEGTEMPVILPQLLYSGTWADGHSVLITAPIKLTPLKQDASIAHIAAAALASQGGGRSSALVDSEYWRRIVNIVGEYDDSEILRTTVTEIERIWGTKEFEFGVSHGDWTRANVGMIDGRVAALDWERCVDLAPKGIDIAHFAICENPPYRLTKARSINVDRVAEKVKQYFQSAELHSETTEAIIVFALLEMVIRFKSAKDAGLRSTDSKFGPALQEGVRKWA